MTLHPPAGWYPDPGGQPDVLRYWDGGSWTGHRSPVLPGYLTEPAAAAPLAPSGLRRVEELFRESFHIIRTAWLPILAIGAIVWAGWAVLALAVAAATDAPRLIRDFVDDEAIPIDAAVLAPAIGVLVLAGLVAMAVQYAAVYRLAAEAATGRSATLAVGWQGAATGAIRILGYSLLLAAAAGLGLAAVIGIAALILTGLDSFGLSLLVGIVGLLGLGALMVLLIGRLVPAFVQATVPGGAGALGWSWRATGGRFWAVLGRYMLWSLAASAVLNAASWLLWLPLPLALAGLGSASAVGVWAGMLPLLLMIIAVSAVSGFTLLGLVPIWRDLTRDPEYRSIDDDGMPITR